MRKAQGLFITLEGCDGSGKTTQSRLISEMLKKKGYEVLNTREPGGTPLGDELRRLILSPKYSIDPYAEALLYASDRAQHVADVIKPAVLTGMAVVCDRFVDSSIAYQACARKLGIDFIKGLFESTTGAFYPDLTLWLDITPKESFLRKGGADGADRIEQESLTFHDLVYEGFYIAHNLFPERIKRIDARRSQEKIFENIAEYIEKLI